jgi:hypothetical protein
MSAPFSSPKIVEVDPRTLTDAEREHLRRINEQMSPGWHLEDCPVHCRASLDCVWPLAVCAPEDWRLR